MVRPSRKNSRFPHRESAAEFEKRAEAKGEHYVLHLYVAGTSPRSVQAVENIDALCREYLPGRYELEVVDIHQKPEAAVEAQIIAAPTLVKKLPAPLRRFIGNLSDRDKVLRGLNVSVNPS